MAPRGNGFNNRGRGRGAPPFRGQPGRGQPNWGRGRGGPRPTYNSLDVIDVNIQRYADDSPASGYSSPAPRGRARGGYHGRGRGRGRGAGTPLNLQVFNSGRPAPPPRRADDFNLTGRGAGRGPSSGLGARYNPNLPLSKLLALDRPYLRPINFVRAQLTPVLFEREEELIESHEFKEPEDHVPTAEQVSRVFSHHETQPPQDSFFQDPAVDLFADVDTEPIIIVDFASLDKLLEGTTIPQVEPEPQATFNSDLDETAGGTSIFNAIMQALSIKSNEPLGEVAPDTPSASVEERAEQTISVNGETTITIQESQEEEQDGRPLFIVDAEPEESSYLREEVAYTAVTSNTQPLGSSPADDEEVIVYVAPHPRSGRTTPGIPTSSGTRVAPSPDRVHLPVSRLRGSPSTSTNLLSSQAKADVPASLPETVVSEPVAPSSSMPSTFDAIVKIPEINHEQAVSPRARRLTKRGRQNRTSRWKGKKRSSFGNFGAMLEERHLHEEELLQGRRVRREGSDIDWGDGDSESEAPRQANGEDPEIECISSGLGGMEIDKDLDVNAMESFVRSMSSKGMEHVTIDDINDADKLRLEDEEEEEESSGESEEEDSEADAILKAEEEEFIGETNEAPASDSEDDSEDEDDDDISSDDDESQDFQTRLAKVRQSAKAKGKMKESAYSAAQASTGGLFDARMSKLRGRGGQQVEESDDDDDSDEFDAEFTWAEEDEQCIADLQDLLDDEDTLMSDRKQRKALFKSVLNGDFAAAPAKKKRDYGKDLPPNLLAQWEKDRARKAENKRKRAAARLEAASDPFAKHKGGKKGRKAMLRAARLAEEAREDAPPNAKPDMGEIAAQFREYLYNISMTHPMSLPPMDKFSRARVHEIAAAFGLKSQSKGKGVARYTTIVKTSRSGIRIDERKIQRLLRSGGSWSNPSSGKGQGGGAPKHKEGDEVGKEAPKIGESNIGFKMLANMGWAEGEKIGVSGGLDAPITAIIKHSKLGLGATR